MMRPTRVRATAFAKVTLSLRVLGQRPDGYHELEALAVSIGQPHDSLEPRRWSASPACASTSIGEDPSLPDDDENLAARAADRVLTRAGRQALGVQLTLRKRIPVGGGLGGGSADAAATLVAVRHLLELELDEPPCSRWPPASAPTCRSACRAARPGCRGGASCSSRCGCRSAFRSWW